MGIFPWIFATLIIMVEAQFNDVCPALFLRYSACHTYCQPTSPSCNIIASTVTQEDMDVILTEHNNLRSKIATGKEQKMPPASNMMELVWDDELAAVAQKHANRCKFAHDCSNCRRVQNFGVGQNLAIETSTNNPNVPIPNWPSAIKSWYDEVELFDKSFIDPFVEPPADPTYGHFSQLAWADSWRIGCGYALYYEENSYKKLYTCNYGPAGNIVAKSMYKEGTPCTGCPVNACCDKTCGVTAHYPGLCKITDDRGPTYKPQESYLFYCDFQNQTDCSNYIIGPNKWLTYNTLSGGYVGIVLDGGEESTMVFITKINPTSSPFCCVTNYRMGPNVEGEEEAHTAIETFTVPLNNYELKQDLQTFSENIKQQFSQFSMSLGWDKETEIKITFSVPPGYPEQFLEIQSIYAKDGNC